MVFLWFSYGFPIELVIFRWKFVMLHGNQLPVAATQPKFLGDDQQWWLIYVNLHMLSHVFPKK